MEINRDGGRAWGSGGRREGREWVDPVMGPMDPVAEGVLVVRLAGDEHRQGGCLRAPWPSGSSYRERGERLGERESRGGKEKEAGQGGAGLGGRRRAAAACSGERRRPWIGIHPI